MNKEASLHSLLRKNAFVKKYLFIIIIPILVAIVLTFLPVGKNSQESKQPTNVKSVVELPAMTPAKKEIPVASLKDSSEQMELYRKKMSHIINGDTSGKWTISNKIPLQGAILPFKRIIAFYGNFYSKQMGILGEFPKQEVLDKLGKEVEAWQKADSFMEVQPALHYIAVTAQGLPGKAGKYRLRMPFSQIDSLLKMAEKINAIVFLDIQVGLSTLQEEIPELEKYLKLPNVHLGIDPEFSMKGGQKPGSVIGEFDVTDINFAADYLEKIVKANNLPPKVLVVHRFTQGMIKNYRNIKTRPEVQIVMHMDGWGIPAKKINTYKQFIYKEPVEYTGFKLFYKNDTRNNGRLLTQEELLKLKPQPVYIQYQ